MKKPEVNNSIYYNLGQKWYEADDDPIALLRAEARFRNPWIFKQMISQGMKQGKSKLLDIGCGGGFLSNSLIKKGVQVTGIDISEDAINTAKHYDTTKRVHYLKGDAYNLPFLDNSFDFVCAMDFLEHVNNPEKVIQEASRVLKPGGSFFFYTFNRNFLSWLLIIKGVELILKKTPPNLHVYHLFLKPEEIQNYCNNQNLKIKSFQGVGPKVLHPSFFKFIFKRKVPSNFSFAFKKSLKIGYLGHAIKK